MSKETEALKAKLDQAIAKVEFYRKEIATRQHHTFKNYATMDYVAVQEQRKLCEKDNKEMRKWQKKVQDIETQLDLKS